MKSNPHRIVLLLLFILFGGAGMSADDPLDDAKFVKELSNIVATQPATIKDVKKMVTAPTVVDTSVAIEALRLKTWPEVYSADDAYNKQIPNLTTAEQVLIWLRPYDDKHGHRAIAIVWDKDNKSQLVYLKVHSRR